MAFVIHCPDGIDVRGDTREELRANAEQHIAERHAGEDVDVEDVMATAEEE
jgi:predicted RNase H-like HicB family nuclease